MSQDDTPSPNFECALSEGFIYTPSIEEMVVIDFNDDGFAAVTQYLDKMESDSSFTFDPIESLDQETFSLYSDNSSMNFDQLIALDPSYMPDSPSIINADLNLNASVFTSQTNDVGSEFA